MSDNRVEFSRHFPQQKILRARETCPRHLKARKFYCWTARIRSTHFHRRAESANRSSTSVWLPASECLLMTRSRPRTSSFQAITRWSRKLRLCRRFRLRRLQRSPRFLSFFQMCRQRFGPRSQRCQATAQDAVGRTAGGARVFAGGNGGRELL